MESSTSASTTLGSTTASTTTTSATRTDTTAGTQPPNIPPITTGAAKDSWISSMYATDGETSGKHATHHTHRGERYSRAEILRRLMEMTNLRRIRGSEIAATSAAKHLRVSNRQTTTSKAALSLVTATTNISSSVTSRSSRTRLESKSCKRQHNSFSSGQCSFWDKFFKDFCHNSSFHGLNHFVDKDMSVLEKMFWAVLFISAVIGAGYSIHEIWISYLEGSTETVVETTYFKNALIAFPAVVICEASRVDWNKVQLLSELNIPEYSDETEPAIRALLKSLSSIEFGEFDEFHVIREYADLIPKLRTLRISDLLLKVMRTCDEVFIGRCWWKSHEIDCCTIFELQKTEFGFCYSFNSDLSEYSKKLSAVKNGLDSYWRDPDGVIRPRRTASRGQWSGLRVRISTPMNIIPPNKNIKAGVKIIVGEPRAYFVGGEITVPAGQHGQINIWGDRLYSTERLRNMNPSSRNCLYSDEESALGLPYYLRHNCKSDCYKYHVYKYCNCTPDFMFFELNENNPKYPLCTVEDLLCLNKHNAIFNNMLPNYAQSFFEANETGIYCDCKADCTHQMYIAEASIAEESNSSQEVFLDVHFRMSTCILYRSDLMFGWLDLLVSFGGCTGLFLGGSLLSCFELIYFVTLRLYCQWRMWKSTKSASRHSKLTGAMRMMATSTKHIGNHRT